MIKIAISAEAFEAIAATLPLGSIGPRPARVDMGLLTQTAEPARKILDVETDSGRRDDRCGRRPRLLQGRGRRGQ
jgi:hypothetical protein